MTKVATITIPVRVLDFSTEIQRGVKTLDKKFGEHWVWWVDDDLLALDSGSNCILGQVFREKFVNGLADTYGEEYDGAVTYLFNDNTTKAVKHGFNLEFYKDEGGDKPWFTQWKKALAEQRPTLDDYDVESEAMREAWDMLTRDWLQEIRNLRKERKALKKVAAKIEKDNLNKEEAA